MIPCAIQPSYLCCLIPERAKYKAKLESLLAYNFQTVANVSLLNAQGICLGLDGGIAEDFMS